MTESMSDPGVLTARLERLEMQNRRLRVAVALVLLFPVLAWMRDRGHFGTRSVVADEFVLRGDDGATRARLGLLDDGSPALALMDVEGSRLRAGLSLFGGVPSLTLYDPDSKARASLSVSASAVLRLFDRNDTARVRLEVEESARGGRGAAATSGRASLGLFDDRGHQVWSAP